MPREALEQANFTGVGAGVGLKFGKGGGHFVAPIDPGTLLNLYAWYDAGAGISLNGGNVSQWNDLGPHGFNLIQSIGSSQPPYVMANMGGPNGNPYLVFHGSETLENTSFSLPGDPPTTIFVVYLDTSPGASNATFGWGSALAVGGAFGIVSGSTFANSFSAQYAGGEGAFFGTHVNGMWQAYAYRKSPGPISGGQAWLNGPSIGQTSASGATPNIVNLGLRVGGFTTNFLGALFTGYVAEIVIVNGVSTNTDIANIFSYFSGKYGFF